VPYGCAVPCTLRNIKEDLEDLGSRFDGASDLEFRSATGALELELEQSGLRYQAPSRTPTLSARSARPLRLGFRPEGA
jgi:hypothetical protein